jgi:hypothetical protein
MSARITWSAAIAALLTSAPADAGERATHLRLTSANGPVHVWQPAHYDHATAGVVIYVHGYFTSVDAAWKHHRLPSQFAESGINATFIACEAPSGPRQDVHWPSTSALLELVDDALDDGLPRGRVIAVGHSGAHRTLSLWLEDEQLDTIILVDAVYGEQTQFRDWLEGAEHRRLIDAAAVTRRWSERLHASLPGVAKYDRFPAPTQGRLPGARGARVVYVRSQHDHMKLVTGGVALPMLLRASSLPTVGTRSRKQAIRVR